MQCVEAQEGINVWVSIASFSNLESAKLALFSKAEEHCKNIFIVDAKQ